MRQDAVVVIIINVVVVGRPVARQTPVDIFGFLSLFLSGNTHRIKSLLCAGTQTPFKTHTVFRIDDVEAARHSCLCVEDGYDTMMGK